MKKVWIVLFVLACAVVLGSCDDDEATTPVAPKPTCISVTALEGSQQNAGGYLQGFFSIQLRRISGDDYQIHVYDRTEDVDAYGSIVVTDLGTQQVILSKRFPAAAGPGYGSFNSPGSYDEALTITANNFRVYLEVQEYSGSSLFFGDDRISHWHPPTDHMIWESRDYCVP